MTFPAVTLGFILATIYGAIFHLLVGGDARRLAVYLVTAWLAFALGQVLGTILAIQVLKIGTLHLFTSTVTTLLALVVVLLVARRRRLFAERREGQGMTSSPSGAEARAPTSGGRTQFRRVILLVTLVPLGIFGLIFLIAVVVSLSNVQGAAEAIRMLRDLMLIFIALELALIFVSLSVLLVQIARLVNLLTEEVAPILETTQETVQAAQNTVQFAGRNLLGPFIDGAGFLAGVLALLSSLFGLRRAYSRAIKVKRDDHAT